MIATHVILGLTPVREYAVRRDILVGVKAPEFSIFDKSGKNLQYRIESKYLGLHKIELVSYPSKQVVGRLNSKVTWFLYEATFEILNSQTQQWTTGSINQKLQILNHKSVIEWNGRRILMEHNIPSLTTRFLDDQRGGQLVAEYKVSLASVFWATKYSLQIFSSDLPDALFIFDEKENIFLLSRNMPTILLIDCSLGMAERFSFVVKQENNMETTMNIEKRSLVAKLVESLMTNTSSPTKLETIALVLFAGHDTIKIVQHFTKNTDDIIKSVQNLPIFGDLSLKSAIDFAKKYLTTTFGAQRSQKILVFTDSSHREDDPIHENTYNNKHDQMDIDLRKQTTNDEQEKTTLSNSPTDISYVCIRQPSSIDRARLGDITEQAQCSFSKLYWLINRDKENNITVTNDMIQRVVTEIKSDSTDVFISILKCGHYESQLAVYPKITPAILQTTGELLQPSNTLTVNGFIELSSIRSAMATSKHILLPIQRYIRPQPTVPMFATKKSAASTASASSLATQRKSNTANNFYYLLLISLKKEKSTALVSINDQWFGAIHCQKFERKKKSSRLILSVFEPGDCIPWISSFERLGPYAVVFPPVNNGELVYKKQLWPVKPFPRSYTETFLIWCRHNNFQNDINKFVRASAKLPDKVNIFHRELNKICRGAFIYGLRERLFVLLRQLFQQQIQMGKIKPEGVKYVQNVIMYMNRLGTSDRYIKYEETST
ncbi:unnamed protein product [Rotaria magnacalcarata]|uniref:Integrator complex subunit 14 n=2 Tax=Rotaria magnacalcarata TaxID=392030 RepID=A0A819JST9_9BILA|nr:unnamed protein product [Rotaria magnacalcarata]